MIFRRQFFEREKYIVVVDNTVFRLLIYL